MIATLAALLMVAQPAPPPPPPPPPPKVVFCAVEQAIVPLAACLWSDGTRTVFA